METNISKQSGIYMIKNTILTDRVYVGSSNNLETRKNSHFNRLNRNEHENSKLQNCFNKNGNNFEFIILEKCEENILIKREQYYIDNIKPYYNICKIAGRTFGYVQSKESKEQMSVSKKQLYANGFKVWNTGISPTQEVKDKISNTLKGKFTGENHPFYNGKHTEEAKKLMVEASNRRKGTHHKGHRGKVFKLDKNTLKVIDSYSSTGAAAESCEIKGTIETASNKIGEAIKYKRCAYKFRWAYEDNLDQIKLDELLEIPKRINIGAISSQALDTTNEGSETT